MKSQIKAVLPEGVEKGFVSFWYVKEGDKIKKGAPLVEFVTEKTSFTLESPFDGTIIKLLAGEGAEVINEQIIAELET
jgi:pyruvate dehydrogenase E2 component (dihydrolipoamide acetyltransferase)